MSKPSPQGRSLLVPLLLIVTPLVAAGGVVFGVIWLGWLAKEHLGQKEQIEFATIECNAPPGMSRAEFLDEVQYGTELPDRLDTSDDLVKKLFAAFIRHPWVEEVREIKLLPEQRVRVQLRFRTPVLAVEYEGKKRAVDSHGIRLSDAVSTDGLPVLRQANRPGPAGTLWGDERVTATARTAAFLHDGQEKLAVTEIAGNADSLVLTTATGAKILWGHAPGDEGAQEASAEQKRERLLARESMIGQIDVRQSNP